ncbi:MAG: hypothetical protein ACI9DC_004106 [Gammaproteobacteria bacterium]|jgi:hypothetical protein
MATKIEHKIVSYSVKSTTSAQDTEVDNSRQKAEVIQMHERLERPDVLIGSTYKIKTPLSEHSLYVTINDVILNEGTEHEVRRPFEIFINSKNMEHFQWIVALTRIISAVFRKGGDVTFLVEELQAVFDPKGGYFKKGGKYMPSLVAEIGDAIENHMRSIGLLDAPKMDEHRKALIESKRNELAAVSAKEQSQSESGIRNESFPESAQLCVKCSTKAVVQLDGCMTCLNCGDSKCG